MYTKCSFLHHLFILLDCLFLLFGFFDFSMFLLHSCDIVCILCVKRAIDDMRTFNRVLFDLHKNFLLSTVISSIITCKCPIVDCKQEVVYIYKLCSLTRIDVSNKKASIGTTTRDMCRRTLSNVNDTILQHFLRHTHVSRVEGSDDQET